MANLGGDAKNINVSNTNANPANNLPGDAINVNVENLDEVLNINNLVAGTNDVTLVLQPDGSGGTEFTTYQSATEDDPGQIEIATQIETNAGLDDTKAITPLKLVTYVTASGIGLLDYKGAYDANTNTPDLTTSPNAILKGDTYTVTVAGTFFTEAMEVGDLIIAEIDNPTVLDDWTRVNKNIDQATTTVPGIIQLATQGEVNTGTDPDKAITPDTFEDSTRIQNSINHIADAANPHSTDIGNLGSGTLAELNTAVTDATLDDSGDSRPPSGSAGGDLSGTYPNPSVVTATTTTAGKVELATDGESSAGVVVQGNDARLSDARTPTSHGSTHTDGTDDVADMVGDSGAGGIHGLVPAPGAGDAASNKFLKADATWATPSSLGDVVGPGSATDDNVVFFDGITGKLIKDSGLTLSGTNTGDEVSATTATEGIVEIATQTEVNTGTDTTRVVTPATLANYTGRESTVSWPFASPGGSFGTFYFGGFYDFAASDNDFSPSTNWGTANSSYAAHFMIVLGAVTVDELTITVTGTRIQDDGTRTTSYVASIVIPNATPADSYFETSEKFLGQVTVAVSAGTAKTCNYGWAKYWDNHNHDYTVESIEALWLGGGNDNNPDIALLHHKDTGWTFNAGSTPTLPTALARMSTIHSAEKLVKNNEQGAFKVTEIDTAIDGSGSEGIIWEVTTTANNAFELGSLMMTFEGL